MKPDYPNMNIDKNTIDTASETESITEVEEEVTTLKEDAIRFSILLNKVQSVIRKVPIEPNDNHWMRFNMDAK